MMIAKFRKKVGDDWFAFILILAGVIVTIGITMFIVNLRQTVVSVDARKGVKVNAPTSESTDNPQKDKTKQPDDNNENQPDALDARQNGQNALVGQFLKNILLLVGVFVLVILAMTAALTAAIIFWQRWRAGKSQPVDSTPGDDPKLTP
jgi:hypothetical protein